MAQGRSGAIVRAIGLLGGCLAAAAVAWWLSGDLLHPALAAVTGRGPAGLTEMSFSRALDAASAAVLLGCVGWLGLGSALTVMAYAAAVLSPASATSAVLETLAELGCPRRLRRLVLACLGVAIGATGPAIADPPDVIDRLGAQGSAPEGISGLPLPDRTTGSAPTPRPTPALRSTSAARSAPGARQVEPSEPSEPARAVLVRPGDSLWTIASDLLPASASDRAVTAAWHRLHRANRAAIGCDPDLLLPGTRLDVPKQLLTRREER